VIRRCPTLLTMLLVVSAFSFEPAFARADGIANYTLTTIDALPAPTGPPPGTPSVTLNSTLTSGSPTAQVPSATGLNVGYLVSGTGVLDGTTVSQISSDGSQVTLSNNATVSGAESLVFTPIPALPQVVALVEPAGGVITPPSSSALGPLSILAGSQGFNASGVYDYLAKSTDKDGNPLQLFGLSFYGQGLASLANGGMLKFSLDVADQNAPPQLVSQMTGVSITLQPADSSTGTGGTNTGTGGGQGSPSETPEPLSILIWSALAGAGLLRLRILRKPRRADSV
jgi:hypothetical protein